MQWEFPGGKLLKLVIGDITRVPADAIVNAANAQLRGGGGVDGAIHRAGGPSIMRELDEIRARQGGCPTGSAVVTGAGNLPARYVFHAVGPIWRGGDRNEAELLASCYRTCLALAEERGLSTISFPSISTGAYGYPVRQAAEIAMQEVCRHLQRPDTRLREVIFVLFDQATFEAYAEALRQRAPVE
ncbi:MAG: O-acetyl-ADP-ribose deacetylase [Bryobacterales bacterium]|nr:O-acetyl-ADP-ribose deacetylase [Bryobacteraceae bacterium]MDW8131030.1 O-acetyl-ADP-ribose deacetylase [Bryobacterales bacterium]